jgi:hypothetical protein
MSDSLSRVDQVPREERRSESPSPSAERAALGASRLAQLQEEEQLWFSWLTVLHDRLSKIRPSDPLRAEGHKVMEIARRRWLEAREALRNYQAGG